MVQKPPMAYDALGNLVSETDPLGNQTRFVYTVENLLEQVTYANGATQSLTYDLAGNVISETDGEGNTKRYQYDRVNHLIAVIDEAGNKTSYGYGNKLSTTYPDGRVVSYTYDSMNRMTSVTGLDGEVFTKL